MIFLHNIPFTFTFTKLLVPKHHLQPTSQTIAFCISFVLSPCSIYLILNYPSTSCIIDTIST